MASPDFTILQIDERCTSQVLCTSNPTNCDAAECGAIADILCRRPLSGFGTVTCGVLDSLNKGGVL